MESGDPMEEVGRPESGDSKQPKFRFSAKSLGLTYPQTDCSLAEFVEAIKGHMGFVGIPWAKLVIGREEHTQEDGKHFHCYIGFAKKWQTTDVRAFDLLIKREVRHPNWKGGFKKPSNIDQWISYCKKEGDWHQEGFLTNLFTFKHWRNFRKESQDLAAWERMAKRNQLKTPFPFNLPTGVQITEPEAKNKRCNWLIMGPPDCGKTWWAENAFAKKLVFKRSDNKYPFEADKYKGEPVIIYDDISVKLQEFIQVANCYNTETPVYGDSRYISNYWPIGQRRLIIWLMNPQRLPWFAKPDDKDYEIFKARFRFIKAVKNGDNWDWIEVPDTVQHNVQPGVWENRDGM